MLFRIRFGSSRNLPQLNHILEVQLVSITVISGFKVQLSSFPIFITIPRANGELCQKTEPGDQDQDQDQDQDFIGLSHCYK